jgi:hypothetical protein
VRSEVPTELNTEITAFWEIAMKISKELDASIFREKRRLE